MMCALALKEQDRLKNNLLVSTIMSNLGLKIACRRHGLELYVSNVGDRYVLEDMIRLGAVIGGEQSGHAIFLDHHTTGDGIITAMQVMACMVRTGKRLSELAALTDVFPQKLINVNVKRKLEFPEFVLPALLPKAEGELEFGLSRPWRLLDARLVEKEEIVQPVGNRIVEERGHAEEPF